MCLSYENGLIPGNLHYKEPNPQNESLKAGILQVRACASMLALPLVTLIHSSNCVRARDGVILWTVAEG